MDKEHFLINFMGMMGLEKSDQAMNNICFKLKGYHNFGDPNDRVLKNNALHYGNIRLALQSYGDKCTHTAVTCVIASGF